MRLTPTVEQDLWSRAGVRRIADLRGFPFPSHDVLVKAVMEGHAKLGIEYAAARDLVWVTKSPAANALFLALHWVTPCLSAASVALPFITGNWWALGGVLSSFLGLLVANPYNPAKLLTKLSLAATLLHLLVARSVLHGAAWISFCFAVCFVDLWIVNFLAWEWAHAAVLKSEALATLLFKTRNLHIRDRAGVIHNAEPDAGA